MEPQPLRVANAEADANANTLSSVNFANTSPLRVVVVVLAVATLIGVVLIPKSGEIDRYREQAEQFGLAQDVYRATVVQAVERSCEFDAASLCVTVTFRLDEGPDTGDLFVQVFPESPSRPDFEQQETVVLAATPGGPPGFEYQFSDRERRSVLAWVALAFALAVIALGRWRGLAALAGLGISVGVILWLVLPGILNGAPPVLVALTGASLIAFGALYLTHGFQRLTDVALIGTLSALVLTAALSALVLAAARISGFSSEEAIFLSFFEGVDIRGLVLAGTVLGAAGALDDVTVTQASAVHEIWKARPETTARELFRRGLAVGRDHIAATVNTLLLAYAGASLPLLVLFVISGQELTVVANSEVVAVEIIRTLVGSLGLVAAVPVTTYLAARVTARQGSTSQA